MGLESGGPWKAAEVLRQRPEDRHEAKLFLSATWVVGMATTEQM